MAQNVLLGVFEETNAAANALEAVQRLGVPDNRVTVMSAIPIRPQVLGRHHPRQHLSTVALVGALLGLGAALGLTVGTPLLYPLIVGGQPLIPIPPSLVIVFELTMLGTMWVTFIGFVLLNRFPTFGKPSYNPQVTAGQVGVVVETDSSRVAKVESALKDHGALDVQRLESGVHGDLAKWRLWLFTVLCIGAVVFVAGGLLAYDVIRIPFPTNMVYQESTGNEGAPRLAAPAESVPVQGPVLIADQPASQPVPADTASLQRGHVLYNIHCALCHDDKGTGAGRLSGFFKPQPANLSAAQAQDLTDQQIFVVITNGFGVMPSLHEDLLPAQRWDVINWVRTLKK
jgi:mono/diheme cytochrome c family protein